MANVANAELLYRDEGAAAVKKSVNENAKPKQSAQRQELIAKQSISTAGYKHFVIDVWLMDFNPVEFGIFKRSRNRAKSRQFTQDMDIYAEVVEEGERTGLIGYRKDLWKKQDDRTNRLVLKMFSDKLNWRATMDLMLARSIQQTIGARLLPVMTYSLNSSGQEQLVSIERSANKWPLMPENFSFFLLEDGNLQFYRIRQDFFRFGDDYSIYDSHNKCIGRLDGAFFSISGKWRCRLKQEYASKPMLDVLKMFAGMLIFNNRCRRHIKRVARQVKQGKMTPQLEPQEVDLYMNPRRTR